MAFDHKAFREAHRPWSFTTADGRTFQARHVSAPQYERFDDRFNHGTAQERRMAVAWILRIAFPWRLSYLLRGDPVKILLAMEPAARKEALMDFFACLRGESPIRPQTTTIQSGLRWSGATPPPRR